IFLITLPDIALQAQSNNKVKASGIVTGNTHNKSIPDVSVTIRGVGTRTITDKAREYEIEVSEGAVLVFSCVADENKEVRFGGGRIMHVTLTSTATLLDEAVIIGYGSSTKKEITGSVATIKTRDFNQGVFTDAIGLIQGKVAGLSINKPDGADPL